MYRTISFFKLHLLIIGYITIGGNCLWSRDIFIQITDSKDIMIALDNYCFLLIRFNNVVNLLLGYDVLT